MEQETAASLKIALRKLIHSSEVKAEAIQQIAEELSNQEISVQDWENLFKQDGADIALEQKIHTPQLTRLLTIRAIVIPQTVPEFLQWLNIQEISDVDESQKTSWAFQKKIKQFFPPEKIGIGIQYILLQLLENKIKIHGVVWLLSNNNSIWVEGKKELINNIKYDLELICTFSISGRIQDLTKDTFRIQIGIWSEIINYWKEIKISDRENKKYQKYNILGKLFTEIKEYELAAYFYQISQSKISSRLLKLLVNSNNITPETILGLPIKESRHWINYISKFFNKDIDEQEKIFKKRREKYLELLRKYKEIDDYNQDIKNNPNDPEYYYDRGNTRRELGDKQGAIDDYTQVIKLNPNSAYAYILRGDVRSDLGDKQGAIDDFNQSFKLDPSFANSYFNKAYSRYNSGDKQGAIDDYTQAIKLNPNYTDAYYNRGLARTKLGDNQGAIDDYTQAIKLDPKNAKAYYNRGFARTKLGDNQGAIDDYNQAIKLDPNYAYAYNNRGWSRYNLGDNQGAIDDYNQAIKLDPNYADAYHNRGLARTRLGDNQGAIDDYNQAIKLDLRYARLETLLQAQNFKEADEETEKIVLTVAKREKEGWLRIEDAEKFPCKELRSIDQLWLKYSRGKFGISVQQQIYQSLGGTKEFNYDVWKSMGDRVGWRQAGEWLYYDRFYFSQTAPSGHLPARWLLNWRAGRWLLNRAGRVRLRASLLFRHAECNT